MAASPRSTAAGGFPIAMGAMIGTVVGLFDGEVTPSFLIGLGLGIVAAVAIWWRDRAR